MRWACEAVACAGGRSRGVQPGEVLVGHGQAGIAGMGMGVPKEKPQGTKRPRVIGVIDRVPQHSYHFHRSEDGT